MIELAKGLGNAILEEENERNEFFQLDKDRNNTVDFDEFKQFVKKNMLILIDRKTDD